MRRKYHVRVGTKWEPFMKMRAEKHASTYKPTYPSRYEDSIKAPVYPERVNALSANSLASWGTGL